MAAVLGSRDDMELAIACKCEPGISFREKVNGVTYYSVPYTPSTPANRLVDMCREIIDDFSPQIVQIEGTEFPHAPAMAKAARDKGIPFAVSLQGILNGQLQYQCGQLPIDEMMFSRSIKNIVSAWTLHLRKTRWYKKRLPGEAKIISEAENIIGRTTWDRAHAYRLNPKAPYYSCNRTLRAPFYENNWSLDGVKRHSIYVGNGYYALKGVHYVVRAVAQLMEEYPDVKVYVAGHKPFYDGDKRPFYKKGYGLYLEKLIRDLGVGEHIVFTGSLNADEVAGRLSKTHAYVLCSAIENSPNTLGEAMLVGTPCVAAYVGGVSDMATDGVEALFYRNDDPALLAWSLKRLFDSDALALELSANAKKRAAVTHDPVRNAEKLIGIYEDILKGNA